MSFLETSAIIDYLAGVEGVVAFVDDQETLFTSSICVYEVLAGEVLGPGPTDVYQRRQDFGRVQALDFSETVAIEAAQLQRELMEDGVQLAARDMMIAATARSTGAELVVADSDFEVASLESHVAVRNLRDE
ncbi:PIN domain containing protein [Halapricum desulfuricans]|uniref:PIN domain containing protein n=1 Tax=Halapricum desulfuricans TaxID=2841257 RepID=A0A897NBB8_9EURY|nr:PIN domain-containing protein [Halapricum desulfuricans]QSG11710.1 PIN domain containing protein [Halapricum desulfuricans]